MKKIKLDLETLAVMTFATSAPEATPRAAAVSAEITDCTCRPYFCINWPGTR